MKTIKVVSSIEDHTLTVRRGKFDSIPETKTFGFKRGVPVEMPEDAGRAYIKSQGRYSLYTEKNIEDTSPETIEMKITVDSKQGNKNFDALEFLVNSKDKVTADQLLALPRTELLDIVSALDITLPNIKNVKTETLVKKILEKV